ICGWGLFTTVRITQGEAFAYERHWRRLEKDAALTRLPLTYSGARVRVHLHDLEYGGQLEKRREHARRGPADNHRRPAAPSGERTAGSTGTRAARGFAARGSENNFVAEQRVGRRRGTSRRVR